MSEVAYIGGWIHTQDDARPRAESPLARAVRIVAVGTTDEPDVPVAMTVIGGVPQQPSAST